MLVFLLSSSPLLSSPLFPPLLFSPLLSSPLLSSPLLYFTLLYSALISPTLLSSPLLYPIALPVATLLPVRVGQGSELVAKTFKQALPSEQAKMIKVTYFCPFKQVDADGVTTIYVREIPCPWPITNRFAAVVQDYVRVSNFDGSGRTMFYTYNHDIAHPYFERRDGFAKASVKYQVRVLGGSILELRRSASASALFCSALPYLVSYP